MPRYNLSPREMRHPQPAEERDTSMQDTAAMLQQLAAILGIQQEQQMGPEKLRALQLSNTQAEQQGPLIQQSAEADARLRNAQADRLGSSQLTPEHIMQWHQMTGKELPPELMSYAPPEYQQFFQQRDQKNEAQRLSAIAEEEARMAQPVPVKPPHAAPGGYPMHAFSQPQFDQSRPRRYNN